MGTDNGEIMEFGEDETTYNGKVINAEWHSGFYDFEIEYQRKTMRILWISLKSWCKTSLNVNYISDRDSASEDKEISTSTYNYPYWSYANFSYNTSYSIKPFKTNQYERKSIVNRQDNIVLRESVGDK